MKSIALTDSVVVQPQQQHHHHQQNHEHQCREVDDFVLVDADEFIMATADGHDDDEASYDYCDDSYSLHSAPQSLAIDSMALQSIQEQHFFENPASQQPPMLDLEANAELSSSFIDEGGEEEEVHRPIFFEGLSSIHSEQNVNVEMLSCRGGHLLPLYACSPKTNESRDEEEEKVDDAPPCFVDEEGPIISTSIVLSAALEVDEEAIVSHCEISPLAPPPATAEVIIHEQMKNLSIVGNTDHRHVIVNNKDLLNFCPSEGRSDNGSNRSSSNTDDDRSSSSSSSAASASSKKSSPQFSASSSDAATKSASDESFTYDNNNNNVRSRKSNKKRRKKLKLARKAATAAAATAAISSHLSLSSTTNYNNSNNHHHNSNNTRTSQHPGGGSEVRNKKLQRRLKNNNKKQVANIAVVCATESIANFKEECLRKSKKIR